jgi:hypothetical protein
MEFIPRIPTTTIVAPSHNVMTSHGMSHFNHVIVVAQMAPGVSQEGLSTPGTSAEVSHWGEWRWGIGLWVGQYREHWEISHT